MFYPSSDVTLDAFRNDRSNLRVILALYFIVNTNIHDLRETNTQTDRKQTKRLSS